MVAATKKPLIPPSDTTHTTSPHNNDVLCGRGGTINAHPGNEQYRKFVERKKRVYLTARFKREKRLIASSIVEEIRNLDPPGRFLQKDPHSDVWYDVGDEKARDKTSQALRENALSVRKQMEEEFQETRRQQAREVAIAAGRDPEEAVKNMMSAVNEKSKEKKKKDAKKQPATGPHPPPGGPPGAFVGRSGYGPLYNAQQPGAPPGWGYHGHGGAPPPHPPHPGYPPNPSQRPPHGAHPPPPVHSSHYPPHPPPPQGSYYQHPPPQGSQAPYSYGAHPPPTHQPPHQYPGYGPGWQQQPQHPQHPPQPQHQHQPQTQHQPQPQHQHQHHHPQHPPQHPPQPQQTTSQPMMPPPSSLPPAPAPAPAGQPPPNNNMHQQEQHQQQQHQQQQHQQHQTHSMMPSPIHRPAPISTIEGSPAAALAPPPAVTSTIAPCPTPPISNTAPPIQPRTQPPRRQASRSGSPNDRDRHVQFQNDPAPPMRGIPLIISSKNRIQPRKSTYNSEYSTMNTTSQAGSSSANLSPISRTMSQATGATHATSATNGTSATNATSTTNLTPLTLLSGDVSVRTSDSLSHYLQGIEDEISGDVGQEVELVAHAPMLDSSGSSRQSSQEMTHHNYRGNSNMYSRSTPPRHGTTSSHKSSGSRHSRRRKRRSGHIPSNSGKVQVDWSSATAPAPAVVCGMGETGMLGTSPKAVGSSGVNPCGDGNGASASCGVILPTPLRGSNNAPRSPTASAMAPPPGVGIQPLPGGGLAPTSQPLSPGAPMSPVHSLDLEKMSLCGTENVSQAGGSIGGASLCNVFDENDDSIIGASALMDMTMSLGSHPSSGPGTDSSNGPLESRGATTPRQHPSSPVGLPSPMGLHTVPMIGLNPQAMFGDERSFGGSALMDMSVGSGKGSRTSGGESSSGSRRSGSGRSCSPASIEKTAYKLEQEQQQYGEESREMPPPQAAGAPAPSYIHDFKFTWDGKREE